MSRQLLVNAELTSHFEAGAESMTGVVVAKPLAERIRDEWDILGVLAKYTLTEYGVEGDFDDEDDVLLWLRPKRRSLSSATT